MTLAVAVGILLVVLALVVARSVVVVPADHVAVVERLGRPSRTLAPGLHLLMPLVDRILARVPLIDTARPLPRTTCITLDNRTLDVDGVLRLRIVDATAAITAVADYDAACVQAAVTALREEVARLGYEDARESSRHLANSVAQRLGAVTAAWGVQVVGTDLSIKR